MRICINVWMIILEANDLLRLKNIPVNNFSVMSGRSHRFLGITRTIRGVNVSCSRTQHGEGRYRTPTSRSGVRGSTTRPLRSPLQVMRTCINAWMSFYFGEIQQLTPELSALESLKNLCIMLLPLLCAFIFDRIFVILAGKEDSN